ncbi:MAG: hypothetical protein PF637_05285 [Spirochaetes bacterium]|nr:hypothetical protein [Spirochaetota bacterium]
MKFVVDIEISIQSGFVQDLTTYLFNDNFSVNTFQLTSRDLYNESYHINVVYSNQKYFDKIINKIKLDPRCLEIDITNRLEQKIVQGLLHTGTTLDFSSDEEYETNLMGAYLLLDTLINSAQEYSKIYFHTSVCSVSGIKRKEGVINQRDHELAYIANEKASSIISKFAEINSSPLVVAYTQVEDFTKTLIAIQDSYSLFHVHSIPDEDDPDVYRDLFDHITIPHFCYMTNEKPALILSGIYYCMKKYKLNMDNTNIGIIGLDSAAISLTAILKEEQCLRVLGYDDNEKSMMMFESKHGLATTKKNILENCDIVIIIRDQIEPEDIEKIRPGLICIPFIDTKYSEQLRTNKSVKYILDHFHFDSSRIKPGIVKGLLESGLNFLTNQIIREIAKTLVLSGDDIRIFPPIFSDIHKRIEDLIKNSSDK